MKNKITKILIIALTATVISGCSSTKIDTKESTEEHKDTFTQLETDDKGNSGDTSSNESDDTSIELPQNTESYDDRNVALGLSSDMVVDDEYIASLQADNNDENSDETKNNNGENEVNAGIDYKITTDNIYVKTVIDELYANNGYTSHEVINEFFSDMPDMDGYEYSVSLRFNNNDVHVIYLSNGTAYSIEDVWGSYDN